MKLATALCMILGLISTVLPASAQAATQSWRPDQNIEIVVPNASGGSDRTARFILSVLQSKKLIDVPGVVVNKPGGGGAIGLAYLNQHAGSGRHVLVTSPSLLTNHITGKTTMTYRDLTPLAVIGTEHVTFSVLADSPLKAGADLIARLKQDGSSVSFGMASALGNHNHIAIGQLARAAGADLKKLKIVVFPGAGQVVTSLLGGHVDVIAAPGSTITGHVQSGKARVLAVSSERRLPGRLADVPTWTEQGAKVISGNVRNIVGPKEMTDAQIGYWDGVLKGLTEQEEWKNELNKRMVENNYMNATQTRKWLDGLYTELTVILRDLGLAKGK